MDHPTSSTGDWPAVPPAPAPVRPISPPTPTPEPPIINPDVHLITPAPTPVPVAASLVSSVPVTAVPAAPPAPVPPSIPAAARVRGRTPRPLPPPPVGIAAPDVTDLRPVGIGSEVVWQPRFAIWSAAVIVVALIVVTLPLWIVLYRLVGTPGAATTDILALCMMLLGGFLAGGATWAVLIEMRGRVRMVDSLARGDRELPVVHPMDLQSPPVSAVAALEASSRLLSSFSGVLRSFGQLWAQVAMLTVALALFAGATVLSLH